MKLEIPQEIIRSVVQAQVVAALGKSEDLIRAVVQQAMEQKKDSYSRTTVFEDSCAVAIREVSVEAFKEWLAENKEKVRAEMRRQLTAQKSKIITDLVDGYTKNLATIYPSVTLNFEKDR